MASAKRRGAGPLLLAFALLASACGGNSKSGTSGGAASAGGGDQRAGITDTEIRVGGVASVSNALGGVYGDAFDGVQAYFDKVNAAGGVDGRQLKLVAKRDDNGQGSRDATQLRALVEQDGVFAVLPVSVLNFQGASYLRDKGVPTFGWNINPEWAGPPNLFGEKGSFICFDCPNVWSTYLAKQLGVSTFGILTYAQVQSADCAKGWENSVQKIAGPKAGIKLGFEDTSLQFSFTPGDLAQDIDKMRSGGVQLLATCIDGAGNVRVGQAIQSNQLQVTQLLPNGYDQKLISENAKALEGSYVTVSFFPFEADQKPQALQDFIDAMRQRGKEPNENSLSGWINADLFVSGLKAAGKDVTRQSLVDAINKMTDYTAGGIRPSGVDWTIAHTKNDDRDCVVILQVQGGKLVPKFGQPGKPMLCFSLSNPDPDHPEFK